MELRSLRIALLSYRSDPEVGGQGVYVRALSRALCDLGHRVTVFSGPPYPILDPGVDLVAVRSLDLYRSSDPFRRPRREEFREVIDLAEYASMCAGGFPEPLTFSLRVRRLLREERFDIVHDNQSLGYGLLDVAKHTPVVATIHHPITIDRRLALAQDMSWGKRIGTRRWYGFVAMQARVARRMTKLIAVSESSRDDVVADFGVARDGVAVIPNGVDTELFRPLPSVEREQGRIVTIASSAHPSKGLDYLIEAVAKLGTERDVRLAICGRGGHHDDVQRTIERFGVGDRVRTPGRIGGLELVHELASAEVAVVPSLYEGFSLPAVEAMAAGTPLVVTSGGALPEVVGDAAVVVPPGDAAGLAEAIAGLMDQPARAQAFGMAGRARAVERFSWQHAARAVQGIYEEAMGPC